VELGKTNDAQKLVHTNLILRRYTQGFAKINGDKNFTGFILNLPNTLKCTVIIFIENFYWILLKPNGL